MASISIPGLTFLLLLIVIFCFLFPPELRSLRPITVAVNETRGSRTLGYFTGPNPSEDAAAAAEQSQERA